MYSWMLLFAVEACEFGSGDPVVPPPPDQPTQPGEAPPPGEEPTPPPDQPTPEETPPVTPPKPGTPQGAPARGGPAPAPSSSTRGTPA